MAHYLFLGSSDVRFRLDSSTNPDALYDTLLKATENGTIVEVLAHNSREEEPDSLVVNPAKVPWWTIAWIPEDYDG